MRAILALLLLVLVCDKTAAADMTAIASNGRKVVLHTNGTWTYAEEKEAVDDIGGHFRKARWGLSKEQVKGLESAEAEYESDDGLGYAGNIVGLDCLILYIFVQNQLVRAKYVIAEKHSNKNDYIDDFKALKRALIKKYGKPESDETYWSQDLFKDEPQRWGLAISVGQMSMYTNWATEETAIILALAGDNAKVKLGIEYTSVKLKSLEDVTHDQSIQDDL